MARLAALYDDDVAALLIDEPEISLHPQYQAFLLEEIRQVAGNPYEDDAKKLIILSTHATSMLPLRR
jgi:predicted ATP-dependent endonuclease of OLD family